MTPQVRLFVTHYRYSVLTPRIYLLLTQPLYLVLTPHRYSLLTKLFYVMYSVLSSFGTPPYMTIHSHCNHSKHLTARGARIPFSSILIGLLEEEKTKENTIKLRGLSSDSEHYMLAPKMGLASIVSQVFLYLPLRYYGDALY